MNVCSCAGQVHMPDTHPWVAGNWVVVCHRREVDPLVLHQIDPWGVFACVVAFLVGACPVQAVASPRCQGAYLAPVAA